jgi:ABC-type lipoprotein export system ATPase subunit
MMESEESLLSCDHISKTYISSSMQTKVLSKISIEFKAASINLIYGKSGSGKTTLLNILAGLDSAFQGNIYFGGKNYSSMTEAELARLRGEKFGFVFQAYHLIPRISVEENILCPSYINGKSIDKKYYRFLIKELGIENLITKMPYELSGGEQQRVAIARAMLLKPQIVFADEPTGNLDTENTKLITTLFQNLNKEYKTAFIIVTHEENLIERCQQVIRLKDGEIVIE